MPQSSVQLLDRLYNDLVDEEFDKARASRIKDIIESYNSSAAAIVLHKDGSFHRFAASADTDLARWAALKLAVQSMIAYDKVLLGSGGFNADGETTSDYLQLIDNTSFIGCGPGVTKIYSTLKGDASGNGLIMPANNCYIADFSITPGSSASANGDATIGIGYNDAGLTKVSSGVRIKNVSFENCDTDGFFCRGATSGQSWDIIDCKATSYWDCAVLGGGTFNLHNCDFAGSADATHGDHNGNTTCVLDDGNVTINIFGGKYSATSTTFSGNILGVIQSAGGGTINLHGAPVISSSSGVHFDLVSNDGAGGTGNINVSEGTSYNSTLTNGTIGRLNGIWREYKVGSSNATTTGQSLVDVTGLVTDTLAVSSTYEFEAVLNVLTSADTGGTQYGVHCTVAPTTIVANITGPTSVSTGLQTMQVSGTNVDNTASAVFLTTASEKGCITIKGILVTASGAGPVFSIRHLKTTSGTSSVVSGSILRIRRLK